MPASAEPEKGNEAVERFAQAAERNNDLLAQIIEQQAAPKEPPKKEGPAERVWSYAELKALRDEGKIDESQMIAQLSYQDRKAVAAELRAEFDAKLKAEREDGSVEQRLLAYRAQIPALADKASDEFERLTKAYQELREEGLPASKKTELLAMRMAFPDGGKPKEPPRETTSRRQRNSEATGGRGGDTPSRKGGSPWPGWFEPHRVAYYEKMIEQGRYKGHDDPAIKREIALLEKKRSMRSAVA